MPVPHATQFCCRVAPLLALLTISTLASAQDAMVAVKISSPPEIHMTAVAIQPAKNEPEWKMKKPLEERSARRFLFLSASVYVTAAMDMQESVSLMPHFHEDDPFTKPIATLPAPAYYATGFAFATGINWLAWRMARSERWHKVWWLPQVASIAGNTVGYGYTKAHENRH